MNIILGSGSKTRKQILERAGWKFKIMTADIDEKAIRFDDPKQLTLAVSSAKAEALLPRINEPAILITVDTVVVCNGKIYEKPANEKEAREFLQNYSVYPGEVVNGICVVNTATGKKTSASDISKVKFKPIPEEVIEQLIADRNIFSQAGAFSVEDPLLWPFVEYIDGTLDSVEGLSPDVAERLIKEVKE